MNLLEDITQIVAEVLMLDDQADGFDENTALLGAIPEFDSVAVVSLVTALEDEFGCTFDDDELNADVFATIGSLTKTVEQKLA
ncbi:MAG: acyl carrier protein [Porticoccaceae bacterium]|nr:acyl carrier protein [Pseudomonadales bacterium]MCP5172661.1 acyl carrier protein [Pseudomonadales bacterium]MCP5302135.1 acyl carrier protein [Pseudomonadales bacterium]